MLLLPSANLALFATTRRSITLFQAFDYQYSHSLCFDDLGLGRIRNRQSLILITIVSFYFPLPFPCLPAQSLVPGAGALFRSPTTEEEQLKARCSCFRFLVIPQQGTSTKGTVCATATQDIYKPSEYRLGAIICNRQQPR